MRDVLIVGGGASGLLMAALLLQEGLDVAVWERREAPPAPGGYSRAIGVHAPALDVLDRVGVADQVVAEAVLVQRGIARTRDRVLGVVPFDRVSPRFPFVATLPQTRTEEILRARVEELSPTAVQRGRSIEALGPATDASDGDSVTVRAAGALGDDRSPAESARFVIAADGARSTVRGLLGVPVARREYPDTYVMADLADGTGAGADAVIHLDRAGVVESFPLPENRRRWVVRTDERVRESSADHLVALVRARTGQELDPGSLTMISSFAVARGLAPITVHGRTILLGDAAHEISPIGGQGMNLGWLDAGRLAPLISEAVRGGTAGDAALERYDVARRRRARWAARQAELNMALGRPVTGARATVRDALLTVALRSPARRGLASVYAMRHLR